MATKGDISTLDVLTFGGRPLIPLVGSFSGSRKSGVVTSDASGGASRQRKKYYNSVYVYSAIFFLENRYQQDYIKIFFERNEGRKFICHLAADRPIVEPYVVQVTSNWQDDYKSMVDGQLSVTMEVFSVRDKNLDDLMYILYSSFGNDANQFLNVFIDFVEELPEGQQH